MVPEQKFCPVCGVEIPKPNKEFCSREHYLQRCGSPKKNRWEIRKEMDEKRKAWQSWLLVDIGLCSVCGKTKNMVNSALIQAPDQRPVYEPNTMICLECFLLEITDDIKSGRCLDCGDQVNPRDTFCRSCAKTHNHGSFLPDGPERELISSITSNKLLELKRERRHKYQAEQQERKRKRSEIMKRQREDRKRKREELQKSRKRYAAGLQDYERSRKEGEI